MTDWIKKYWWVLLIAIVAIAAPFAVNWFILSETPDFWIFGKGVVGDGTHWLGFWATYISAIASFAMVIATFWTLRQNAEKNDNNRILQLNILQYQQQMQWFNDLKNTMIEYVSIYDENEITQIRNTFAKEPAQALANFKVIVQKFSRGYMSLKLMFVGRNHSSINNYEEIFLNEQIENNINFSCQIEDIIHFMEYAIRNDFPNYLVLKDEVVNNSSNYSEIMRKIVMDYPKEDDNKMYIRIINARREDSNNIGMRTVYEQVNNYLALESQRINNILAK